MYALVPQPDLTDSELPGKEEGDMSPGCVDRLRVCFQWGENRREMLEVVFGLKTYSYPRLKR